MNESQSSAYSFFTPHAIPVAAGFRNDNIGRGRVGHDMIRETIWRELEKERIREEIIAEEMALRRVLEAEVRNELRMEREMKFLNRRPIGLEDNYGRRGCHLREIRGFPVSQLQLLEEDSPKITPMPTATPLLEDEDNKKELIVYVKPDGEALSGTKRKSTPPVSEGSIKSGSDRSNKRVKEEWSCAVCQVSATSERGLTQHLQGKKHKAKEAALVAQRTGTNFGLGIAPKRPVINPLQLALTTVNVTSSETNKPSSSSDPNDMNKKVAQLALTIFKPSSSEVNKPSSSSDPNNMNKKYAIKCKSKRDKFKFWCEMCQVGAFCEAVMNDHKEGKKHSARVVKFYRKGKVDSEDSATENTCDTKDKTETK